MTGPEDVVGACLPGLVVFDVDGTLQDTFQWWPDVVARGVLELGRRRGLSFPVPDRASACAVVGQKDEGVWGPLLPPEHLQLWRELRQTVIPMEVEVLAAGRDYLFPGTREMLGELRRAGVRIALASNCRSAYFAAVLDGQGLREMVDAAYCLDTPGISTKTDMVALALREAGTRRAVVVGDRGVDQEAARAHGLPFVWREGMHASEIEAPAAVFRAAGELIGLLGRRSGPVQQIAALIRGERTPRTAPLRIGVTGAVGSGKSELARELATFLPGSRVVALDSFLRPAVATGPSASGDGPKGRPVALDHLRAAFDLDALFADALPAERKGPATDLLILEGIFLLRPEIRARLDRILFLDVAEGQLLQRASGRGREPVEVHRDRYLPVHRELVARYPPGEFADWILDNTNLLDPILREEQTREAPGGRR